MFKFVVLLSVAAMAAAKPSFVAPVAVIPAQTSVSEYSTSINHGSPAYYGLPAVYGAPAVYAPAVVPAVTGWSQPGVVLDAANGVPLDTPAVVAARASHYTAKALGPVHHLGKRSIAVAPLAYSTIVARPFYSTYAVAPFAAAYGYPSVYPRALSVHPY